MRKEGKDTGGKKVRWEGQEGKEGRHVRKRKEKTYSGEGREGIAGR